MAASKPLRLLVWWINMAAHTERAKHVISMLSAASAHNARHGVAVELLPRRREAISPVCPSKHATGSSWQQLGRPCMFEEEESHWNATAVAVLETAKLRLHTPVHERQGLLGNWLSHLNAYMDFALMDVAAPSQLLVLEDDAHLSPAFFQLLPCLVRHVPRDNGPWHVVRFGCWGDRHDSDRVAPGVYYARPHEYNKSVSAECQACAVAYGGAHTTLVQRSTIDQLISHLLAGGVMPIDIALRESPGRRQFPGMQGSGSRFGVESAPNLRSFVVDTPAAWMSWSLPGWRADSAGMAGVRSAPRKRNTARGAASARAERA
uniref:Uncharacterized protein n=1 Tax=Coccolithus braarudii TaxID=221442 RepID=A0A7S0Q849_9EUKA